MLRYSRQPLNKLARLLMLKVIAKLADEKGFTIIGLQVTLAISVLIAGAAGMTIANTFNVAKSSNEHTTAVRQAQNLGSRASLDLLMAETATTDDDPETAEAEFIIIQWSDLETGYIYDVRYLWADSGESTGRVARKQTIYDDQGMPTSTETGLVAENIHMVTLSQIGGELTLSVEARTGESSETKHYNIKKRLGW